MQNIRKINKQFRQKDESHLWPINGEFNVTDRAIRRLARQLKTHGIPFDDYKSALEQEISQIVNNEVTR
jgi:hypothetical protein